MYKQWCNSVKIITISLHSLHEAIWLCKQSFSNCEHWNRQKFPTSSRVSELKRLGIFTATICRCPFSYISPPVQVVSTKLYREGRCTFKKPKMEKQCKETYRFNWAGSPARGGIVWKCGASPSISVLCITAESCWMTEHKAAWLLNLPPSVSLSLCKVPHNPTADCLYSHITHILDTFPF